MPILETPRRAPILIALTAALAACDSEGTGSSPPGASRADPGNAPCTVSEIGRHRVSPEEGVALYVEAHVVGRYGDGVLVAGQPTYSWTIDRGERASRASAGDLFGALLAPDGTARRIPMPPGVGPVGWTRGAPLDEGRWLFIFEELDRPSVSQGNALRVLVGEYGPSGWSQLDVVPQPPGVRILTHSSSAPVATEGGFRWATPFRRDSGDGETLMYERSGTHWEIRPVPTGSADAADLLLGPDGALWLSATGLDPAPQAIGGSVRLLRDPSSGMEPLRLDQGGAESRFWSPTLLGSSDAVQVAWLRQDAQGSTGAWVASVPFASTGSARHPAVLLDDAAAILRRVGTVDGVGFWATLAVDAITDSYRIRLHRVSVSSVQRIADIESPFQGPFNAMFSPDGELLLIGPEARVDTLHPFVRSLVIRLSLSC